MSSTSAPVFIIADIEGSSGCWNRRASEFRTPEWARACADMSLDIGAVAAALLDAGTGDVYIKDFHRTGYNLLPELVDRRARIIHGYRRGPVPGIGGHRGAGKLLMVGMHAASGSDGFLAHTLTSRIARLEVNGRLISEAELFSSSLAPYGMRPVFLSGCAVACRQAEERMPGIRTCAIDKSGDPASFRHEEWRRRLAARAVESLADSTAGPYLPEGPFSARITMRDGGETAARLARRWKLAHDGDVISIETADIASLYLALIRICYLTPTVEAVLPAGLLLYNAVGRLGLAWARAKLRSEGNEFMN
jgi:D-amino peptidase